MNQGNEQIMPANRVHHCMTSVREFLIIYGGSESNTGSVCDELLSYNTISGVWKRHQLPIEIKDTSLSSSICSDGHLVYIFGGDGLDYDNYRQTNSIVSFNIITDTWDIVYSHTDEYDQNTPPPMSSNYLLYHDGSLYVLGGYHRGTYLDTIYKFCLKSSMWSLLPQHCVKPTFSSQMFGTMYKNQ
ncbi:Kelch-like protein 14 [Thelohanellus kitauei]|uniref:Kelch-like protein 14 n=1 Tax=Thelohanellus kitauei TaxID=669202 RepID=A0A0C2N5S5_THEKT|nr:Kelch-like protein 14 [Thelohanellus kitauei]